MAGTEDLEVFDSFAQADVFYGYFKLVGDAEDDSAFGCAVELGDGHACDFGGFCELACLFEGVLACGAVEYEEYFVGGTFYDFVHDVSYLGELVHQADLVVEAAGGVDQDDVGVVGLG